MASFDAPAGKDHLRMEADRLRLVGQIIGIDADAVAADKAGPIAVKVPLRAGGGQDVGGIQAEFLEQHGQFVHERDVDVSLDVSR